ncbi:peroxidase [Mergibacter septicus]|uniref:Dyp-type peroxidase n=1 Tax=Mergibacter septicus TaxID=221402 RepID=UPI001C76BDBE|nr:Dyp-type peroxidase [Mergibacter septicus]QDJ13670.1 peroxidase [Mergibacter septicus]
MKIQSGILLEHSKAAIFIEAKINDYAKVATACKEIHTSLTHLQHQHPDAKLGLVIAFGHSAWRHYSSTTASELKTFQPLGKGDFVAPATQRDLLIHIISLRPDVNFSLALEVMRLFNTSISIDEETHGFRWIEERDFTGFVDGTENPQGEDRPQVATINQGIDAGGSYVLTQRWVHHLAQWHTMSQTEQEQVIGRTKPDSVELDDVPENSHVGRVDLKENGQGLKILRQSLPYGKASGEHGLYFIAYCARLHNIEQQLLSMYGYLDGKTDRLLEFTQAVSGSYYFAPPLDMLLNLS